jgi:hypothetical protein
MTKPAAAVRSLGPSTYISIATLVAIVATAVTVTRAYESHTSRIDVVDIRIVQIEKDAAEMKAHAEAADERSISILQHLAKIEAKLGVTD